MPENLDQEMLNRATAVADRLVDTVAGHLVGLWSGLSSSPRRGSGKVAGNSFAILPLCLAPVERSTSGKRRGLSSQTRRTGGSCRAMAQRPTAEAPDTRSARTSRSGHPGGTERARGGARKARRKAKRRFRRMPAGFDATIRTADRLCRWQNELKARVAGNFHSGLAPWLTPTRIQRVSSAGLLAVRV